MIGGGADDRQTQGHVDAVMHVDGFQRDQCLIVVHADRGVVFGARSFGKHGVRRPGAGYFYPFRAQDFDGGSDNFRLVIAQRAAFARMGV